MSAAVASRFGEAEAGGVSLDGVDVRVDVSDTRAARRERPEALNKLSVDRCCSMWLSLPIPAASTFHPVAN
jgi:hypothetical protein